MSNEKEMLDYIDELGIGDSFQDADILEESVFEYQFPEEKQVIFWDGKIWWAEPIKEDEDDYDLDVCFIETPDYNVFDELDLKEVELFNGFMLSKELFETIKGYVE
jgi:hypothetical protein